MGGSTNTVLHGFAIAHEAGVDYPLERLNEISAVTPCICKVSPSVPDVHMQDVDRAGGIAAILKEISRKPGLVNLDCLTVTGQTLGENIAHAAIKDPKVIRTIEAPFTADGGLAVLFGNLAPKGSIVKSAGVDPSCYVFEGEALVFESQDECLAALALRQVKAGQVVVIRYEGPKGGPGMPEMLSPTSMIKGQGLGKQVALITDGRFSGGTAGLCIGPREPRGRGRRSHRAGADRRPHPHRHPRPEPQPAGGPGGTGAPPGRLGEAATQDQQGLAGPLLAARHQRQPGCGAGPAGGAGLIADLVRGTENA